MADSPAEGSIGAYPASGQPVDLWSAATRRRFLFRAGPQNKQLGRKKGTEIQSDDKSSHSKGDKQRAAMPASAASDAPANIGPFGGTAMATWSQGASIRRDGAKVNFRETAGESPREPRLIEIDLVDLRCRRNYHRGFVSWLSWTIFFPCRVSA
jgi:hypothetical protein